MRYWQLYGTRIPLPNCHCSAYSFPHSIGRGRCYTGYSGSYRTDPSTVRVTADQLCRGCGQPAEGKEVDFGIGAYEFWGAPGVDINWQVVTDCCECEFVANTYANAKKFKWPVQYRSQPEGVNHEQVRTEATDRSDPFAGSSEASSPAGPHDQAS